MPTSQSHVGPCAKRQSLRGAEVRLHISTRFDRGKLDDRVRDQLVRNAPPACSQVGRCVGWRFATLALFLSQSALQLSLAAGCIGLFGSAGWIATAATRWSLLAAEG